MHPLLAEQADTWAVDLVGWGFTDNSFTAADESLKLSPAAKRAHLHRFWQQHIQRPMVLVGASLGGAVAIDFAVNYPEVGAANVNKM